MISYLNDPDRFGEIEIVDVFGFPHSNAGADYDFYQNIKLL
jgi:hypothetical protein